MSAVTSEVIAYTDGACSGNPGPGGWGVWLRAGEHEKELFGGEAHSTNQRMELRAAVEALRALKRPCHITIYSDSRYVIQGITEWIGNWKRNGWKTAAKKNVVNADLWKELDQACAGHTVQWKWVKGHAGNEGNERADELARRGVPKKKRKG
jgi:ribonuclease HI